MEGLPEAFAAPVTAIGCDRPTITGRGTIDGGGWWTRPKERRDGPRGPRTLHIAHGTDVTLTGFALRKLAVLHRPSLSLQPADRGGAQ